MTPDIITKLSKVVTVYPQEGESRVNVNTADPLVLQSLDPRITQNMAAEIVQARPFKTIQELDRVSSFEDIGKELRQRNLYDIKSDLFLARMIVRMNEVIRNATVVLRRDPNSGTGTVLYYRVL
jgi:general secretion pathway protein K